MRKLCGDSQNGSEKEEAKEIEVKKENTYDFQVSDFNTFMLLYCYFIDRPHYQLKSWEKDRMG